MWLLAILFYIVAPAVGTMGLLRNARPYLALGYFTASIVAPPLIAWGLIECATIIARPGEIVGMPVIFMGLFTAAGTWVVLMIAGVFFAFLGKRDERAERWKDFPLVPPPESQGR